MNNSTRSRPRGAAPGAAGRLYPHGTPRLWSSAYPTLDEAAVREAVTSAGIRDLARALDRGAFRGDHGANGFACPRCERWDAEITSPSLWYCAACQYAGTRLGLVQSVLADALACVAIATGQVRA